MLAGSEVITRVALAIARNDEPCISIGVSSSLVHDVDAPPVVEASELSKIVVRCGAAGMTGERGEVSGAPLGSVVSVECMDAESETTTLLLLELSIEMPSVPKTLRAVRRRL
jgi:hypothetical protein